MLLSFYCCSRSSNCDILDAASGKQVLITPPIRDTNNPPTVSKPPKESTAWPRTLQIKVPHLTQKFAARSYVLAPTCSASASQAWTADQCRPFERSIEACERPPRHLRHRLSGRVLTPFLIPPCPRTQNHRRSRRHQCCPRQGRSRPASSGRPGHCRAIVWELGIGLVHRLHTRRFLPVPVFGTGWLAHQTGGPRRCCH